MVLVVTVLVETALVETALVESIAVIGNHIIGNTKTGYTLFFKLQDSFQVFLQLIMPQSFCFNLLRSAEEVTLYLFVFFKLLVFVMEI